MMNVCRAMAYSGSGFFCSAYLRRGELEERWVRVSLIASGVFTALGVMGLFVCCREIKPLDVTTDPHATRRASSVGLALETIYHPKNWVPEWYKKYRHFLP